MYDGPSYFRVTLNNKAKIQSYLELGGECIRFLQRANKYSMKIKKARKIYI